MYDELTIFAQKYLLLDILALNRLLFLSSSATFLEG